VKKYVYILAGSGKFSLSPRVTNNQRTHNMSNDIQIIDKGFSETTVTLQPITESGKAFFATIFGHGAVSVEMPKSKAIDFSLFAQRKAINVGE